MGEEVESIEQELELQLVHQKESLAVVSDALATDSQNDELLKVHEELIQAIKDSEDGLLELKRARLLEKVELISGGIFGDFACEDVQPELSKENAAGEVNPREEGFDVGSRCRFRHTNGRWYDGNVVGFEDDGSARLSFLTPTSEKMLMCKFFLQNRCRFGSSCRLSHGTMSVLLGCDASVLHALLGDVKHQELIYAGILVPRSSLKPHVQTVWGPSFVGSGVLALSESNGGIWKEAELVAWDDGLKLGNVVFRLDGTQAKLPCESLSLPEPAGVTENASSQESELDESDQDSEENNPEGVGFLTSSTAQQGVQTETAIFAGWELHTRGIASKMMASMGYREGMGLGAAGQGIVNPVSVKILPAKQSLDFIHESQGTELNGRSKSKGRSRGGKRKREKRYAEAARARKDEEQSASDMFDFINNQLATQNTIIIGSSDKPSKNMAVTGGEDRRSLIACEEEAKELRLQIEKLAEMVNRNRKDKVVYEAVCRKLDQTRRALAEAEAAHASASHAVNSKEKEKRWLKF